MIGTLKAPARIVRDAVTAAWDRRRLGRLYSPAHGNVDPALHLREAIEWLVRAQDTGENRGFSYGARFGEAFLPSYPETTGYIIPTFFRLADAFGDPRFAQRAVQAADWEIDVQMACGAVMAGRVTETPKPAVFNTGQVLLGWTAAFERTGERRFREAMERAARWLIELQEPDGNWTLGNSPLASATATVYNVKAAWGLCRAGMSLGNEAYVKGAVRNAEYALRQQTENGWFGKCCLTDPDRPLLHTRAYTLQGLIGIGLLTERADFIAAAGRTADALISLMAADGFIPGRIARNFTGTVDWCCLTGSAQMAIVWARLQGITGEHRYREAYDRVTGYLVAHHDVTSAEPTIRGGVAGSWPVWGEYGQYMVLNWATKFFVDALLAERQLATPFSMNDAISG